MFEWSDIMNKKINYDKLPHEKILCVDMKSFYASIEAVDRGLDPLKVHLAVIGDKKQKGSVVLAASAALKEKYGIKTGSRLYEIPKKSEIIKVEARMGFYLQKSLEITSLYNEFVPLEALHIYSIDEAWLKLDGTERLLGDKWQAASKLKKALLENFGLPSSMGLGPNMFLAKVAMDIEGKKEGLVEWKYEDVPDKLWPLKLSDCWGIGSRLERKFNNMGIKTVGDLAQLPLDYLEDRLGIMGSQLYYHARGVDCSKVEGHFDHKPKNLGKGITLLRDYDDLEQIKTVIFELSEDVARRIREYNLLGKTVSLGISYSYKELKPGFHVQKTLNGYTNLAADIYKGCLKLLKENYKGHKVRKIRVSFGNFIPGSALQLNLFDNQKVKDIRLTEVKDQIENKFGPDSIFYAKSLKKGSIRKKINDNIGGHKA